MIAAGSLDTRIRLIPPGAAGSDAWGNPAEPAQVPVDRWASVRWMSGKELVTSGRKIDERIATIRVRDSAAVRVITTDWQLEVLTGPAKGVRAFVSGINPVLGSGVIELAIEVRSPAT